MYYVPEGNSNEKQIKSIYKNIFVSNRILSIIFDIVCAKFEINR